MRKNKKILSTSYVMIVVIILSSLFCISNVKAEGLIQSDNIIYKELSHEHSQDKCYETKWISCGGYWCSNFEYSVGATVYFCSNNNSNAIVNGVRLGSIHPGWVTSSQSGTHSGEYCTTKTCDIASAGRIKIEKTEEDGEQVLNCSIEDPQNIITDYSIKWKKNGEDEIQSVDNICIDSNGSYIAEVNWYDSKSETWHTDSITFSDISFPIELRFMDGEEIIDTDSIAYGAGLPAPPQKLKVGYTFDGYSYNGTDLYDANFDAISGISTKWEKKYIEIQAKFVPKEYDIYYGEDLDEDGILDNHIHVIYGQSYENITYDWDNQQSNIAKPDRFDGLMIDGVKIYDENGNALFSNWQWDVDDGSSMAYTFRKINNSEASSKESNDENNTEKSQLENPDYGKKASVSDNTISSNNVIDTYISDNSNQSNSSNNSIKEQTPIIQSKQFNNIYKNTEHWILPENNMEKTDNSNNNVSSKNYDVKNENLSANDNKKNVLLLRRDDISDKNGNKNTSFRETMQVIGTVSLGVIGGGAAIYGLIWYLLILYKSAEVYTYSKNNKRVSAGKTIIRSEGNNYKCVISQRLIDNSETGRFEIVFTGSFIEKYSNKILIIQIGKEKRLVSDIVKPVVYVNASRH